MNNRNKSFSPTHCNLFEPSCEDVSDLADETAVFLARLPMSQLVAAIADLTVTLTMNEWAQLRMVAEQRGLIQLAAVLRCFSPMAATSRERSDEPTLASRSTNPVAAKRYQTDQRASKSPSALATLDFNM